MADEARVEIVREDAVAILFLHHPPENRLTQAMIRELSGHVAALEKDPAALAVIVAGAGKETFSQGLEPTEWSGRAPRDAQAAIQRGFEALWALEHVSKPTVAAIEGGCWGAGAELALACDLRVASESATFAFPEVDDAWMPSHGGTARLPRVIGRAKALELLLTGTEVTAQEALELGLVEHMVPQGEAMTKALELARAFAAAPPAAAHHIKRTLTEAEEKPDRNRFLLEAQHSVQLLADAFREAQEKAKRKEP